MCRSNVRALILLLSMHSTKTNMRRGVQVTAATETAATETAIKKGRDFDLLLAGWTFWGFVLG